MGGLLIITRNYKALFLSYLGTRYIYIYVCMYPERRNTKIPGPCATVTKVITCTRYESERVITRPLDEGKRWFTTRPLPLFFFSPFWRSFYLSEAREDSMTRRFRENCFPRFGDCFKRVVPGVIWWSWRGERARFWNFTRLRKLSIKIG